MGVAGGEMTEILELTGRRKKVPAIRRRRVEALQQRKRLITSGDQLACRWAEALTVSRSEHIQAVLPHTPARRIPSPSSSSPRSGASPQRT